MIPEKRLISNIHKVVKQITWRRDERSVPFSVCYNVLKMPTTADYNKASETAKQVLDEYDITEPVINVFEIAQRKGFAVKFFVPEGKLAEVSGFCEPGTKTIYVNSEDPSTRQLFTVAHELGHALLKHKEDEYGVLWRLATPIDKTPLEQEANWFAANLLVPENFLFEAFKKFPGSENDLEFLAKFFGVSKDVIKFRLLWMKRKNLPQE